MFGTINNNIKNTMMAKSKALSGQVAKIQSGMVRKAQAQRMAHIQSRKAQSVQVQQPGLSNISGFADPLAGVGTLTSNFQSRRGNRMHGGIDIGAGLGTEVKASQAGKVLAIDFHEGGFGNVVVIQHDNGLQTSYAHLKDAPSLKAGQIVNQGQVIGLVGNTGWSTGNHLDFRIGRKLYQNGIWNFAEDAEVLDPYTQVKFTQQKTW